MKKEKLKEIPTAELIDKEKSMRTATYLFAIPFLLYFITIVWSFKIGKLEITEFILPIILLISLFVFLNTIKNMRQELSNRNIDT